MSAQVDVLAVLGACYGQASTVSAEFPNNTLLADHKARVLLAKDLIAELIAADKEYDEACAAYRRFDADAVSRKYRYAEDKRLRDAIDRAHARRASALAAVEQQS